MSFNGAIRNGIPLGLGSIISFLSGYADATVQGNLLTEIGDNLVQEDGGLLLLNTIYPEAVLSLNFLSDTLDSRITFTRGTTATFINSNGLIQSAAINTPRFDYDPVTLAAKGLLIEEQRTNLLTYSEDFTNAAWATGDGGAAVVTGNTAIAPSGLNVADTLNDNSGAAVLGRKNGAVVASGTGTYTASIFVKSSTSNCASIRLSLAGGTAVTGELVLDTVNGAAQWRTGVSGTSFSVTPFGNGWFQFSATITDNGTGNNVVALEVRPAFASTYAPTINAAATGAIFVYGAQLQAGAFATSYIPTVASQVTRSADAATMTGTNFSSWYNQSAGTMLCNFVLEGQTAGGAVSDVWVANNSGSTADATRLREGTVITGADVTMFTGGALQVDSNSFATPVNTRLKSAFAWSTTSSNLTANGVSLADGGAITPPTVNQLVLTGSNKWLQQIAFYNTRLPNATLVSLTT